MVKFIYFFYLLFFIFNSIVIILFIILYLFSLGMSYFSIALCRCILPHLRHRHAKVRCVAIDAYSSCVQIPNREKRKGSGTETIVELIGFREENVLSV